MDTLAAGYDPAEGAFNGTPPDDETLRNVLQYLYLQRDQVADRTRTRLTDEDARVVAAIYAIYEHQGIDENFSSAEYPLREKAFKVLNSAQPAEPGGNSFHDRIADWGTLSEAERMLLLQDAAAVVSESYSLPVDYSIEFMSLGEGRPYAQFNRAHSAGRLGTIVIDLSKFDDISGKEAIGQLLHEMEHVYQAALMRDVVAGTIGVGDPRHQQVELFFLSQAFYAEVMEPVRHDNERYYDDPREHHSQQALRAWYVYWDTGTLSRHWHSCPEKVQSP